MVRAERRVAGAGRRRDRPELCLAGRAAGSARSRCSTPRPRPGPRGSPAACSPPSPRPGPARRSCSRSASSRSRRWPAFAAELTDAAGRPAGLRTDGTVVAATGSGDRAELDALAAHLARLGRPVERLTGRELRRLEPGLGPEVRGGLSVPDDLAVDNRLLLAALRAAGERAGVAFAATGAAGRARRRRARGRRARRRTAPSGRRPRSSWRGRPLGRAAPGAARAGPAGEGRDPAAGAAARRLPDAAAHGARAGRRAARLPRAPRRRQLVLGATQTEVGFDTTVTVGGVRDLLRDAERILPGIAEYALVESAAGLRPGSPDNLPLIGSARARRPAGRHRPPPQRDAARPVTADAVAALLRGEPVPGPVACADPARFVPAAPRR